MPRELYLQKTHPFQLEPRPVPGKIALKQGRRLILVMAARPPCHEAQSQPNKGNGSAGMNIQGKSLYHEVHARSLADPEGFWAEAAKEIDWIEPPKKIFDPSQGTYGRWFTGGVVNTCYNALDRHVEGGRAGQVALIHDSPLTGSVAKFTYAELLNEVQALAAIMQDFGVAKGDRVILYMPMVPEAVVGMLACARIGAVHSVVFGGFAAKELATRIDDAQPKLILSASCGIEPGRIVQYKPLLDEAIKLSSVKPQACICLLYTSPSPRD